MLKMFSSLKSSAFSAPKNELKNSKISVFGFNGIGKINYKRELSGEENALSRFASLSREVGSILISGAITNNYGVIKKSVVVCEKGKLVGICDSTYTFENGYSSGGAFRVYHLSGVKLGVLVADDILNVDGVKAMSLCDADLIVCVIPDEEKKEHNFLIRAYAYLFGVPFYLLTASSVLASDMLGEIVGKSTSETSNIILPVKKQYVLLKTKRRGVKE